jgi:hypothetical protein
MYIGAQRPPGCGVGTTSIGVDIPNGGIADLVNDALIQGDQLHACCSVAVG